MFSITEVQKQLSLLGFDDVSEAVIQQFIETRMQKDPYSDPDSILYETDYPEDPAANEEPVPAAHQSYVEEQDHQLEDDPKGDVSYTLSPLKAAAQSGGDHTEAIRQMRKDGKSLRDLVPFRPRKAASVPAASANAQATKVPTAAHAVAGRSSMIQHPQLEPPKPPAPRPKPTQAAPARPSTAGTSRQGQGRPLERVNRTLFAGAEADLLSEALQHPYSHRTIDGHNAVNSDDSDVEDVDAGEFGGGLHEAGAETEQDTWSKQHSYSLDMGQAGRVPVAYTGPGNNHNNHMWDYRRDIYNAQGEDASAYHNHNTSAPQSARARGLHKSASAAGAQSARKATPTARDSPPPRTPDGTMIKRAPSSTSKLHTKRGVSKRGPGLPSKKHDPVSAYQSLQSKWKRDSFLSRESKRTNTRWNK